MDKVKKVKVGHNWEAPEGATISKEIGGYNFYVDKNDVIIQGNMLFNLSKSPIEEAIIVPIIYEHFMEMYPNFDEISEGHIFNIFDFEKDKVYYVVNYGSATYVFNNLSEGLEMVSFLTKFKSDALEFSLNGLGQKEKDEPNELND